ncbi:MAG: protein phosphatase 2C domain-containing protein [Methanolinea sp.]|nr:protein phosphatase 2C domain-containing protein [Methanolinea sp.]
MKKGRNEPGGEIRTCSLTVPGIRDQNEDACGVYTLTHNEGTLILLAVADGLGGHPAGEVASSLAVQSLYRTVSSGVETLRSLEATSLQPLLARGFSEANREVIRHASTDPACLGMGTTMVAALMNRDGEGIAGNVGDSRAYLFGEGIRRITRDHSRVQEMVDQGLLPPEAAGSHPLRHIVTRVLGRPEDIPDFYPFSLGEDRLILCSDGLLDGISEQDLHSLVSRIHFSGICECLVESARAGSRDNITVVAAGRR